MKAKPHQLKAKWSKSQRDIVYAWGEGIHKSDAHLLHSALTNTMKFGEKSFQEELEARGYDLTTLTFSIMKAPNTRLQSDGAVCTCAEFVQSAFDPNRCAVCRKTRPAAKA